MKKRTVKSMVVAVGVVSLLASGVSLAATHVEGENAQKVKCAGINSCAGKGECGAADGSHDCAGKNSCQGKGWVKTTAQECKDKGGTIVEDKKKD